MSFNQLHSGEGAAGRPNHDHANNQQWAGAESVYAANAALARGKTDTEADQRLRYDRVEMQNAHLTSPHLRGGFAGVENDRLLPNYRRPTVEDDVGILNNRQVPRRAPAEHNYVLPEMQRGRQEPNDGPGRPYRGVAVHSDKAAGAPLNGLDKRRRVQRKQDEREFRGRMRRPDPHVRYSGLSAELQEDLRVTEELDRARAADLPRCRYDEQGRLRPLEGQRRLQRMAEDKWVRRMEGQEEQRRLQRMEEEEESYSLSSSSDSSSSDCDEEDRRYGPGVGCR
ncbi:uncharacterized protein EKO05_0010903 [Ascochyta rabiei]|uniref:Uncharacterized protein n=1 Tax=Didymella rabiei TaxID=5454 RepID=A0A162ZJ83_DIDRA|nr:uncharacterized protein EKO05_0010903 [Ascochyta rabiei]KZM20632.1 hypothetical protein ST47_g8227 [Ascochyta rabiei]UPX20678.1 hypothetical protein EKO05_0010903 [Ascochyta rabiei]